MKNESCRPFSDGWIDAYLRLRQRNLATLSLTARSFTSRTRLSSDRFQVDHPRKVKGQKFTDWTDNKATNRNIKRTQINEKVDHNSITNSSYCTILIRVWPAPATQHFHPKCAGMDQRCPLSENVYHRQESQRHYITCFLKPR